MKETAGARTGGGQARTGEDRRGQARTGEDGRGRAETGGDGRRRRKRRRRRRRRRGRRRTAVGGGRWTAVDGGSRKTRNARYKKDRGIASAVFCRLLSVRQGRPPGYYPIRRAAPQGFRPEPVPESRPGASWRAPRSQGHAPEVPWRPSKFRCCSLRRAPCPWRA